MKLVDLAALFAPWMLDRARLRWPGAPCALYAVGLRDPLGCAIFETMKAIGCVPQAVRKLAIVDGLPVVACAGPLDDLLGALRGLADADRWTVARGAQPVTPGAEALYRALDLATRAGGLVAIFAAEGLREVLPLDEAAPHVRGMFGGGASVGLA